LTDDEIYLTSKQMCRLFKKSRETLRKWREKGLPYKDGKYPLFSCMDWVIENVFSMDESMENDINQERLLRERARRIQDEIKAEHMSGAFVPKDQAVHWLASMLSEARQALTGLPRRVAGSLLTKTDERDIELELRSEINKILWRLAKPLDRGSHKKTKKRTHSARAAGSVETAR
jgi:hypothetical protein